MNIFEQSSYKQKDIESLIINNTEESINLEFKSSGALNSEPKFKKEIAKDISAFANSDGGIIIYGIDEVDHKANSLSFIDGSVITKEWIEQVIISNIQRKIPDLHIFPIRWDNRMGKTIYLIKIPKSLNAPHMTTDRRYFKRYNFESVYMEEYEVRQLYLAKTYTWVELNGLISRAIDEHTWEEDDLIKISIEIQLKNETEIVADTYKFMVQIKDALGINVSYNTSTQSINLTDRLKDGLILSTSQMTPIFPGEILNVMKFTISIPNRILDSIKSTINLVTMVYNPDRIISETIYLEDTLNNILKL
jgi:hypothetical protein